MRVVVVLLGLAVSSCSWARFDDLEENASALVLKQPSGISGFGSALATAADGSRVLTFVAGGARAANGAAVFELGQGQQPNLDAFDFGQCKDNDCVVARSVAALPLARSTSGETRTACWVSGFARVPGGDPGLSVACTEVGQQRFVYTLPLPISANADDDELYLASESLPAVGSPPLATALIAGVPNLKSTGTGAAVVFAPSSATGTPIAPSTPRADFGAAVAVARKGAERRFIVGAPSSNEIWVFDGAGQETGCVVGEGGFGRTLAAGDIDGDGADELVVASDDAVEVIPAAAVFSANPGSCKKVQDTAPFATLRCRESGDVSRCPGGFGASLAVGDVDGDGDGEVAVGVPNATVRDADGGGAVLLYDVEVGSPNPHFVTEERFLSSAEGGDRLGAAVSFAPQASRHLLVAGAPGAGKVAVFYCSRLLPTAMRGSRCK